jgi:hypothetical protein
MLRALSIVCCAVAVATTATLVGPALALDPPTLPTLTTVTLPTITTPTITTATITTPKITTPTITSPTLTTATVTAPTVPKTPVEPPATSSTSSAPTAPVASSSSSGSGPGYAGSSGTATPSAGSSTGSADVAGSGSFRSSASSGSPPRDSRARGARAAVSRRWVSPRARRPTTIVITLPFAAVVDLRVMQIAPVCRTAGRIVVRGHAGRNAFRFRGRVGGDTLVPGTYRITPSLRDGTQLKSILLVVVAGRTPAPGEVASARAADACAAAWSASGLGAFAAWISGPTASALLAGSGGTKLAAGATASRPDLSRLGGILGANFAQTLQDPASVSPVLLILLAIAICLLGLAALPRSVVASPVLAEQLTHRRLELALAGTTTLLVVVLTYMIF